jgi:lipopolysaccharide/colanic/teichoic acid biosynthesis glycosyltransferase
LLPQIGAEKLMKRLVDLLVACVLLLILLPLYGAIALAVRLDSPGPILHRARRVGLDGRLITVFKFRTMARDAGLGSPITRAKDPRITRLGRALRRWKFDELPQIWNVVRGDMSLVGPRPEDPRLVRRYTAEQLGVLSVRPGITGPSQLVFRNEEDLLNGEDPETIYIRDVLPRKLQIDLEYVRRHNLPNDMKILARTVLRRGESKVDNGLEFDRRGVKTI